MLSRLKGNSQIFKYNVFGLFFLLCSPLPSLQQQRTPLSSCCMNTSCMRYMCSCSHQKPELWIEWLDWMDLDKGADCYEKSMCFDTKHDRGSCMLSHRIQANQIFRGKPTFHYSIYSFRAHANIAKSMENLSTIPLSSVATVYGLTFFYIELKMGKHSQTLIKRENYVRSHIFKRKSRPIPITKSLCRLTLEFI